MPVGRTSKKVVSDMMLQMITSDQNSTNSSLEQRDNYLLNKIKQFLSRLEKIEQFFGKTTDNLVEGITNLYFTEARVKKVIDSYVTASTPVDTTPFIRKDGTVDWEADQSHGDNGITGVRDFTFTPSDLNLRLSRVGGAWKITQEAPAP